MTKVKKSKQEAIPGQRAEAVESSIKVSGSPFIIELGSLMYYGSGLSGNVLFEQLSKDHQEYWLKQAVLAMVSLDKMNKMVVKKVEPEELEDRRNKNLDRLSGLIDEFVKKLKTTRPELFPSRELSHYILEGRFENESAIIENSGTKI